ncbi:MAG: hypothetical protein BWY74_03763 [Firmicutes bacterium ADurb.Bin419]|nr:MAG: hypothetical protein BWY74_03763 [Firmicutes bacterium ADurb.Bin419]
MDFSRIVTADSKFLAILFLASIAYGTYLITSFLSMPYNIQVAPFLEYFLIIVCAIFGAWTIFRHQKLSRDFAWVAISTLPFALILNSNITCFWSCVIMLFSGLSMARLASKTPFTPIRSKALMVNNINKYFNDFRQHIHYTRDNRNYSTNISQHNTNISQNNTNISAYYTATSINNEFNFQQTPFRSADSTTSAQAHVDTTELNSPPNSQAEQNITSAPNPGTIHPEEYIRKTPSAFNILFANISKHFTNKINAELQSLPEEEINFINRLEELGSLSRIFSQKPIRQNEVIKIVNKIFPQNKYTKYMFRIDRESIYGKRRQKKNTKPHSPLLLLEIILKNSPHLKNLKNLIISSGGIPPLAVEKVKRDDRINAQKTSPKIEQCS